MSKYLLHSLSSKQNLQGITRDCTHDRTFIFMTFFRYIKMVIIQDNSGQNCLSPTMHLKAWLTIQYFPHFVFEIMAMTEESLPLPLHTPCGKILTSSSHLNISLHFINLVIKVYSYKEPIKVAQWDENMHVLQKITLICITGSGSFNLCVSWQPTWGY